MKNKKYDIKSIVLTLFLLALILLVFYGWIGVFISGSAIKTRSEQSDVVASIERKHKKVERVERHVFTFVTYTAYTPTQYIFFDENATRIATRSKSEAKLDDVKALVDEKYPNLGESEIKIGFGKKNPAYLIEKDNELLVLDYNSLEKVFYMKEGL